MTDVHDHDPGLAFDLSTLLDRRRAMTLIAGIGLVAIGACGRNDENVSSSTTTTGGSSTTNGSTSSGSSAANTECEVIPEETAGPYPGDGSNGPNALAETGVVRRDITASFGSSSTKAEGVPLTINLVLLDQGQGCTALQGAAVYLWHCDRDGGYSMYSRGLEDENYLRGVQSSDANGRVTFTSIFPGCYQGRWPHIHFEVFASVAQATNGANPIATSQLALPEDVSRAVYASSGYESSVANLSRTTLARDNVFGDDGGGAQLATVAGSVGAGYTAELSVPV